MDAVINSKKELAVYEQMRNNYRLYGGNIPTHKNRKTAELKLEEEKKNFLKHAERVRLINELKKALIHIEIDEQSEKRMQRFRQAQKPAQNPQPKSTAYNMMSATDKQKFMSDVEKFSNAYKKSANYQKPIALIHNRKRYGN